MKLFFKKTKAIGISDGSIAWFQLYLSEQIFFISIEKPTLSLIVEEYLVLFCRALL